MKKFLAIALALAMILTMVACGGTTSSSSSSLSSSSQSEDSQSSGASGDEDASSVAEGDPRWNALQTVDDPVSLYLYWHNLQPTPNEEPTEEAPNVRNACRYITADWLADHPNVTIDWCQNLEMTDEWITVNYTAGNGPDTLFYWGGAQWVEKGMALVLDDIIMSPNYYEPGSPRWYDMFPEYVFGPTDMATNEYKQIIAVPVILNPGPATAYYYNKTIFNEMGFEPPTDWDVLKDMELQLKEAGYTPDVPYTLYLKPAVDCWDAWASLSGYYLTFIPELDLNEDGIVETAEVYRAQYEDGFFYLENNPGMVEFYDEIMWKYWNAYDEGVEGIDYTANWAEGSVAMRQEGLWALQDFMSDTTLTFEVGMFPAPVKQNSDYIDVTFEYTEAGPYQPTISVAFNIMDPATQNRPDYVVDYVVDWMKYATTNENLSIQIEEASGVIGATKGCQIPSTLIDWFQQSFPILPSGGGYLKPDFELTKASFTAIVEEYGKKMITKEEWIHEFDELLYQGFTWWLENEGERLNEWQEEFGWSAEDWTDPVKPSWMA